MIVSNTIILKLNFYAGFCVTTRKTYLKDTQHFIFCPEDTSQASIHIMQLGVIPNHVTNVGHLPIAWKPGKAATSGGGSGRVCVLSPPGC